MLSYHADADIDTNPFELGFDRLVNLDMDAEFIGKDALRRIKQEGPTRNQVGLVLDCAPITRPKHHLLGHPTRWRHNWKSDVRSLFPALEAKHCIGNGLPLMQPC